jgi:osmotically-inducible protein OsmY
MANRDWRNDQDRSGDRDNDRRDRTGGYGSERRGSGRGEYGQSERFGDYRGHGGDRPSYRDEDRRESSRGYGAGRGEDRDFGGGWYSSRSSGRGSSDFGGFGSGYSRGDRWGEARSGGYGEGRFRDENDRRESYGRGAQGDERGFWDRASDEVSSWFGDRAAEGRRREDERGQHRGRGPKNYTRSDDRIREDVNDRLSDDPYVDASEIEVTVSSCEVTLSGTVDSRDAKRRAEDCAEAVSGVRHVQNNLRIQQAGAGQGSASSGVAGGARGTGLGGVEVGPATSEAAGSQGRHKSGAR